MTPDPTSSGPAPASAPRGEATVDRRDARRLRAILAGVLPAGVASAVWGVDATEASLHPGEERAVARAVAGRREEFARGRACARAALAALGATPGAIPAGPHRAPVWPPGFVGSITHGAGVVAAAAAPRSAVPALGIDVEADGPLEPGVQEMIFAPGEDRGREPWWPAVVFSAKESVFKALHPEVGEWIPFEAVRVMRGPRPGELRAEGTGWSPPRGASFEPERLRGAWRAEGGRVVTAVWRRAPGRR